MHIHLSDSCLFNWVHTGVTGSSQFGHAAIILGQSPAFSYMSTSFSAGIVTSQVGHLPSGGSAIFVSLFLIHYVSASLLIVTNHLRMALPIRAGIAVPGLLDDRLIGLARHSGFSDRQYACRHSDPK